ncbi:MAG: ZIP family metal transporter [Cytophagales bacterium]|nr:ZIP family metal transporter [Cytophagales bacterium]
MTIWIYSLSSSLLVSIVALVGGFALFIKTTTLQRLVPLLVSLSVGVLLGDAFLHLLPDAIQRTQNLLAVMLSVLGGIFLFFLLEKVIRWRHQHEIYPSQETREIRPLARMNLIGDAMHNFIDGTLIAGSFMVSPAAGVATTIAVIVHEIPQEIGDVGTLIYSGMSVKKAIWYNFLCALSCVAGAVAMLLLGTWLDGGVVYLLPVAAGGFIYIAACDLIPELHRQPAFRHNLAQGVFIGAGIAAMLLIVWFE